MSDYSGSIKREVVKIRIEQASQPTFWYADKVGRTVKAMKETKVHDGQEYAIYKQWPSAKGFEPSGDYMTADVEEL
jgi:hypothetical protein